MGKSQKERERPSSSEVECRGSKHSKPSPGESRSHRRSSASEHSAGRHRRRAKYVGEERPDCDSDNDKARSKSRASRASHGSHGRRSHRCSEDDPGSVSSDEVLIKDRTSHRARPTQEKHSISYTLKSIEKAQREALRSSSSSSGELHVHYIPIVTRSPSPPVPTESCQSTSHSHAHPQSQPQQLVTSVTD
ncbi:hypothetical protein BD289DRAFT_492848, partial [Coniella lustricola]